MLIKSFTGKGLHGYLDLDLKFNNDLTFVVGINGSGKTTALNAIDALISPSFSSLARMEFTSIQVNFVGDDKKKGFIRAERIENRVLISTNSTKDCLEYPVYVPDGDRSPYRDYDHEQEYYRDFASKNAKHTVVQYIEGLPTPMFLGLNRRSGSFASRRPMPRAIEGRQIFGRENIFSGSLAQGVMEAVELAENHYRDQLIEVSQLGEKLRRKMLLELLNVRRREDFSLATPSDGELKKIPQMRTGLGQLGKILGIPDHDIQQTFGAFLDKLQATASLIPKGKDLPEIMKRKDTLDALVNWALNVPELERIKALSEMVEDHNVAAKIITEGSDRYLEVLSRFLEDSGKKIEFSDRGRLQISLVTEGISLPISSFSSGESQIFVILTHLFFNPRAKQDNVFIIDEPELSLHVQWQELFVESVIKANKNVQYIMATHSPSIIMERTDKCVDVITRINSSIG